MGFWDIFRKKQNVQRDLPEPISVAIEYGKHDTTSPSAQLKSQTGIETDLNEEYVKISTSGNESVCPMCSQFEGKYFLRKCAPKLPLCPDCSCSYLYYNKKDLPPDAIISNIEDFILPAECTRLFYKHQQDSYCETDINKQIRLYEKT